MIMISAVASQKRSSVNTEVQDFYSNSTNVLLTLSISLLIYLVYKNTLL